MGYVQTRRRRGQWLAVGAALVLVSAALAGFELGRRGWYAPVVAGPAAHVAMTPVTPPSRTPPPVAPLSRTVGVAAGAFAYAQTTGPLLGDAGTLHRYRVAVEGGTGPGAISFAEAVDHVLADRRGWIGPGRLRLQRVPAAAPADFTVYLATPVTSESMCATAGLRTHGYSSCRTVGKVIINAARWTSSVRDYGADLVTYRTYVLNHEVGHQLGRQHESCPGAGRLAPVMQQQTLGLAGCLANPWPYP